MGEVTPRLKTRFGFEPSSYGASEKRIRYALFLNGEGYRGSRGGCAKAELFSCLRTDGGYVDMSSWRDEVSSDSLYEMKVLLGLRGLEADPRWETLELGHNLDGSSGYERTWVSRKMIWLREKGEG